MSLPSPLTASDEYTRNKEPRNEAIKVTAGLHRQVWVSGTIIFVDVHIANNSKKWIKRLELQLERDVLCYKHALLPFPQILVLSLTLYYRQQQPRSRSLPVKPGSLITMNAPFSTSLFSKVVQMDGMACSPILPIPALVILSSHVAMQQSSAESISKFVTFSTLLLVLHEVNLLQSNFLLCSFT
jgi:hypothetical protein